MCFVLQHSRYNLLNVNVAFRICPRAIYIIIVSGRTRFGLFFLKLHVYVANDIVHAEFLIPTCTYQELCFTSCGALDRMKNSQIYSLVNIDPRSTVH